MFWEALMDISKVAKEQLTKARVALVLDHPFFGSLLMRLKMVEDLSCKALWTDSKVIGYNPEFVVSLNQFVTASALAHEVVHVANGHCWRGAGFDSDKWNEAADHATNLILKNAGLQIPDTWLCDSQYVGMSAESIYTKLPAGKSGDDGSSSIQPGEARQIKKDGAEGQTKAEWKVAISQAAKTAKMFGKLPAGLERLVDEALKVDSDWESQLLRFAIEKSTNDYTWTKPNRQYIQRGLYLPALESPQLGTLYIGCDTSTSITDKILNKFAGHLNAIFDQAKPQKIVVVYVDTKVNRIDEYEQGDIVELTPCGGGGTDFRPFFEHIAEQDDAPVCAIYLTDTEGYFPDDAPDYPVLWASIKENAAVPFGELIYIDK